MFKVQSLYSHLFQWILCIVHVEFDLVSGTYIMPWPVVTSNHSKISVVLTLLMNQLWMLYNQLGLMNDSLTLNEWMWIYTEATRNETKRSWLRMFSVISFNLLTSMEGISIKTSSCRKRWNQKKIDRRQNCFGWKP